jgi:hypothetical protein
MATNEIARTAFEPGGVQEALDLARVLFKSGLVPRALATPEAVFYVIAAGRELGFSVVQSLRSLHIIDGKLVMSADMMVGQVLRSGLAEYFVLIESTDKIATYETKRHGAPAPTRMSYTIEQATRAGLVSKQNWKLHPEAMLRARCAAALARAVYPDALQGMYDPDEAEEFRRPAPTSVVVQAQSVTPVAALEAPKSSPWEEKLERAAEHRKPVSACVEIARQMAEHTMGAERERCIASWAARLGAIARDRVTTHEALDMLRSMVSELPEDFAAAGARVCDAINLDAEVPCDGDVHG